MPLVKRPRILREDPKVPSLDQTKAMLKKIYRYSGDLNSKLYLFVMQKILHSNSGLNTGLLTKW